MRSVCLFVGRNTEIEQATQSPIDKHIYHYADYENTAIKRLMTSLVVRESAVDQLLRENRQVDLYKVVREGIRVSKDSYFIAWCHRS